MKHIIVPTDFSAASVNAAFYAAEIAAHVQAQITLLYAIALPLPVSEVPLPADSYEETITEAKQALEALKGKLEATHDKLLVTCRTTTNSFVSEIETFNRKQDIFAMIMGTSGAGATGAFFLGSFSLTAARHFRHPLIVVPPGYSFLDIQKIGLACDMHNVTETVPSAAIRDWLTYFDAKLQIIYITKENEKMYPEVLTESKFLQNSLAGLQPEIKIITNNNPREGLNEFVTKNGLDLLIVIPKERNFPERLFHKSVTKQIVLHPMAPIMILH